MTLQAKVFISNNKAVTLPLQLHQADLLPEATLELIFNTIQDNCKPTKLAVYAKFCRQQQMAVSSFRANYPIAAPAAHRTARQ